MDSDFGVPRELSHLQKLRSQYQPELPPCLQGKSVRVEFSDATASADPSGAHTISRSFPHTYGQPLAHFLRASAKVPDAQIITEHPAVRVGVVFCGRQSPGGHNVIWGLHNALKTHNSKSTLFGFLGGSEGLFAQKTLEITDDILETYKNQGGYDLLGRTKDQIRTTEQVNAALSTCKALKLDSLVIIGGVTSNTDAAQLAETFAEAKCPTKVVGVPVTLNGDLKNQFVEANVGFDTICKVNSQLISNVCTDALSAEKYYYFIRLMGRKASHVALECTLQSHPNMVILGEEVAAAKLTLFDLTKQLCDAVQTRAEQDKYHGVILLPEGLIESIPEVYALLQEIHGLLREGNSVDNISSQLSPWASALFEFLPPFIRKQLLLHPESDDSAQLSQIETEKLLAHLVEEEMNKRSKEGTYKGKKFNAICHFFGYQARGSLPSKFDCDYAYVLGHIAYHVLAAGLNGYLATVTNLKNPLNKWRCGAAPITAMMTVKRYGSGPGGAFSGKPAVHPATVDLKGKSYELLSQNATKFLLEDIYRNPGPLQFDGPGADAKAVTLCVEDQDYMGRIKELEVYLDKKHWINPNLEMTRECNKQSKPSWSKKLVRKWLNIQSGAHEFHSDHAMLQTRDGRMSYSGDNSCAIVPEEFSEEWLIEAKDESNGIPKFSPEIPLINLRLAVGTWNVGGNSPNENLNLNNWLTTHAAADIYVLGFQEIVPLNAGNVLGAEDSGLAAKWLSIMRKALNNQNSGPQVPDCYNCTADVEVSEERTCPLSFSTEDETSQEDFARSFL